MFGLQLCVCPPLDSYALVFTDAEPQFKMDTFYDNCMKVNEQFGNPMMWLMYEMLDIMYWTHEWWSGEWRNTLKL